MSQLEDEVQTIEDPTAYFASLKAQHPEGVTEVEGLGDVEQVENAHDYLNTLKGAAVETSIMERDSEASAISNFFSNSAEDVMKRVGKATDLLQGSASKEPTDDPISNMLQQSQLPLPSLGDVGTALGGQLAAGSVLDVAGNLFGLGVDAVKVVIPDDVEENVAKTFKDSWEYVSNSEVGKAGIEAAVAGFTVYDSWAKENPTDALRLEGVFNIAAFLNPAKAKHSFKIAPEVLEDTVKLSKNEADFKALITGLKKSKNPNKESILARIAAGTTKSADETLEARALSLILPDNVGKTAEKRVGRTSVDVLGTKKYEPTSYELEVAKEVSKAGIKRTSNLQVNYNILQDKIAKEAKQLSTVLAKYDDVILPRSYVDDIIVKNTNAKLEGNVFIRGNKELESIVENLHSKVSTILADLPSNPRGLLEARQRLDKLVKEELGAVVYQKDTNKTMLMEVVKSYRTTLNELVEEAVPEANVLESLRKQSLKFSALDKIKPKVAVQSATAIGRAWQNVQGVTAAKRDTSIFLAAFMGTGAYTASAAVLPYAAGGLIATGAGLAVYRGVTSATAKRAAAKLITLTDKAIKGATDPKQVMTLKMDRVALIELMKLPTEEEDKQEK